MAVALAEILLDRDDLGGDDPGEPGCDRRDARDLETGIDEAIGGVVRGELDIDELTNPAIRNLHEPVSTLSEKRTSGN